MPIINITQEDLNRMKQPEPGWSLLEAVQIRVEKSKDKASDNIVGDFKCLKGPGNSNSNKDRYMMKQQLLNIKNGTMTGPLLDFIAAVEKIHKDKVQPASYDTDKLIGRSFYGEIKDEQYEGRIVKKLAAFAPDDVVPF